MARDAGKCPASAVKVAKDQAHEILHEAERALKGTKGRFPSCDAKLETAREFMAEAARLKASPIETRNAYIRATYHAGQAKLCPVIDGIERQAAKHGMGRLKPPGRAKPRKKAKRGP